MNNPLLFAGTYYSEEAELGRRAIGSDGKPRIQLINSRKHDYWLAPEGLREAPFSLISGDALTPFQTLRRHRSEKVFSNFWKRVLTPYLNPHLG
jgi:hypothetical protein